MKIYIVVVNNWEAHEYDINENIAVYIDEQKANAERDRLNKEYGKSGSFNGASYFVECYDVIV